MSNNSDSSFVWEPGDDDIVFVTKLLKTIKKTGLEANLTESEIKLLIRSELDGAVFKVPSRKPYLLFVCFIILIIAMLIKQKDILKSRCFIENNYIVMEITRPISDCRICKGVHNFRVFENVTKEEFSKYAYLGQPMLAKGGCKDWKALEVFSYDFFKDLYNKTKGAYESVEEECQFFPFKTEFLSLQEVFQMPESRVKMLSSKEKPWYIGWSNCNPDISSVLRQLYSRPSFLPDDSELSAIDWIFMGYSGQGASMHLDYVQRPSWQAQIAGKKSWYLLPPPECEHVCHPVNITVNKGDIIMVDTNQWYHTTFIEGTEMSITLGSEYD